MAPVDNAARYGKGGEEDGSTKGVFSPTDSVVEILATAGG